MLEERQHDTTLQLHSPFLPLTIRGVLKHQALQFSPLCVESLHQFVGIHWMAQVALWVRGGHFGQIIKFVGPAKVQMDIKCYSCK